MSGKKLVVAMLATALILWAIVFAVALHEKHRNAKAWSSSPRSSADTATTDAAVRSFLDSLPKSWARISSIEGEGWSIYVPCDSQSGSLLLKSDASGHPGWHCEFCDSLGDARIFRAFRFAEEGRLALDLGLQGRAAIESVTDEVATRFENAPVKSFVLTWWPSPRDSLVFVPAEDTTEFETLRAEDENPEGCGGAP
jgi:hypothetical protein